MGFWRLFAAVAVLLVKTMVLFPQNFCRKSRGVKAFARQLRLLELEPEVIRELTGTYKELGRLKTWYQRIIGP